MTSGGFEEPVPTLSELLQSAAIEHPAAAYAVIDQQTITFAELLAKSEALVRTLKLQGIATQAPVAVMMNNSLAALITVFGLARAGYIWVPLNTGLLGDNLCYLLEHSNPELIICDTECVDALLECGYASGNDKLLVNGIYPPYRGLTELISTASTELALPPPPKPHETLAIMYTSGTTGRPKGVIVTQAMLTVSAYGTALVSDVTRGDSMLVWEPIYHIGGAQLLPLPMLHNVGLAFVGRFSASRFWTLAKQCGATHVHYLGGVLQLLLKQPESTADREHSVRIAWGGGCPESIWAEVESRFGVSVRECYGMTEVSSITTYNDTGRIGSVGLPVPWLEVAIESGEIIVKSKVASAMTAGYYKDLQATEKALKGEWFHTGDLGELNEAGELRYLGRLTDNVRHRGENVSALEVESIAGQHELIEDCAMIGVESDTGEQDIKLYIQLVPEEILPPQELYHWLTQRLAHYQLPRYIDYIDAFPRTPSQRIMKPKLSTQTDDCWCAD